MAKKNTNTIGLPVASATTIDRFRFVNFTNGLATEAGDNEDAVAVSVSESKAGDTSPISADAIDGSSVLEVEASAAIALGANVGSAADGKAKTAVANTTPVLGIALQAAAADGEVIRVFASKGAADA